MAVRERRPVMTPDLSFVVVTDTVATIARLLGALRSQTIRSAPRSWWSARMTTSSASPALTSKGSGPSGWSR